MPSFRNVPFQLGASVKEATIVFFGGYVTTLMSFGLGYPGALLLATVHLRAAACARRGGGARVRRRPSAAACTGVDPVADFAGIATPLLLTVPRGAT